MLQMIAETVGIIADFCILAITIFTFYLTVFSKKIMLVSHGVEYKTFFGDSISVLLKNCALRSIPVVKVYVLKRFNGEFYQIVLNDYRDDPIIVDPWHIKKFETGPFSTISNWPTDDKRNWSEMLEDAVLGVNVGNETIWIKPYKNAPLKAAKTAYKKHSFRNLYVTRNSVDGVVVSDAIDYIIRIGIEDMNRNISQKTIFAIVGEKQTLLSEHIGLYNAISSTHCKSAKALKEYLCESYNIPTDRIDVEKYRKKHSELN